MLGEIVMGELIKGLISLAIPFFIWRWARRTGRRPWVWLLVYVVGAPAALLLVQAVVPFNAHSFLVFAALAIVLLAVRDWLDSDTVKRNVFNACFNRRDGSPR